MRSLRGIILAIAIIVGVFILAIAAGALWLNTFIHSAAFKAEVESRASDVIGGPVVFDTIDFDIIHGVKLQGLVTQIDPSHAGGQGALKISAASVNCSYSWHELFLRQLRLTGITLEKPVIVLTKEPTAPLARSESAPISASTPSGPITGSGDSSSLFQFVLDRAKMNNGTVSVRDVNGTSMIELRGLNASANTSGYYTGKDVTGTVKIADIAASNIHVTDFSTPFTYNQGAITASPFDASTCNGKIAGDYQVGNPGPSVLNLNAKGLDVATLAAATASGSSAKLSGSLDFQSKWRGIESGDLNGEGDAQLNGGKLAGVKILHDVSEVLRIKELDDPIINSAKTHFLVQNRETKFIGLQMETSLFRITGDGVIGFSGGLNANLVLILNSYGMAKLPKELAASFVQQQDGSGSIAFQVTGTTANPQTDLPQRLLMQNTEIKNVINKALNKFFK